MSSKRKSPPTKLHEGAQDFSVAGNNGDAHSPVRENGDLAVGGAVGDDSGDEAAPATAAFGEDKTPETSGQEEEEDEEDEEHEAPRGAKKQRLQFDAELKGLNNNSSSLNHNSLLPKRTMDDVLKRLTSKMNHSTIKEEHRRPTPATTPNNKAAG